MNLQYGPNKITGETKEINLDNKITTLIGENGSGKSTILEQLLENYFDDEKSIISYSSGLNESFSGILNEKIDEFNKELTDEGIGKNINSFYFTSEWASLLIYFAYFFENGKTKDFLDNHNYLKGKELKLNFSINNDSYKRYISTAKEKEESFGTSLISSNFHKSLQILLENSFIGGTIIGDINFEEKLNIKNGFFNNSTIKNVFIIKEEIENDDGELEKISIKQKRNLRNKELLSFLGIISKYILHPENTKLYIGDIEINGLSDGEFQLLTIYSLLDLFDGDNTIFLFDEVDSHLHYKNINLLWENLSSIEGKVITTTHIPDSIIRNDISNIRLVNEGLIDKDNKANTILNRLDNISDKSIYEKRVASNIENIVLIDDCTDWFIFLELAKIKLGSSYNSKINSITPIKCSSGCDNGTEKELEKGDKCPWIENFGKINENGLTKNIFAIFDKDNYHTLKINDKMKITEFYKSGGNYKKNQTLETKIVGTTKKTNTEYFMWKRREIENYFLSYTLLEKYGYIEEINRRLGEDNKLVKNQSCDNEVVRSFQAKELIQKFSSKELNGELVWKNYEDLTDIIKEIPKEEISEDIEKMYNFIVSKL